MKQISSSVVILLSALLLLQACTALGPAPREQLIGSWQTTVGAFPMEVTFNAETVQLGSNQAVAYGITGNELTYAQGGKQVRLLSFPSADEMIQTDPVTGTEHRFLRVP